jgi:predicted nucleic acid-binding protein
MAAPGAGALLHQLDRSRSISLLGRTKQGRPREALQEWLTRLIEAMQGRIRGFNVSVANVWADLQHQLDEAGQRMPIEDSYIAATALRYGLTIVTGNDRHFRRPGLAQVSELVRRSAVQRTTGQSSVYSATDR